MLRGPFIAAFPFALVALGACGVPISVPDDGAATDDIATDAECPPGTTLCDGFCVDLTSDPTHCGSCGLDCTQLPGVSPTIACNAGRCMFDTGCAPARAHCSTDTATGCETDLSAAEHCGSCTVRCSGATPVCGALSDPTLFACTGGCAGGQTLCGTTCVNVLTDSAHCGSCDHACGEYEACTNGTCGRACPPMAPLAALVISPTRTNVCSPGAVRARDGMVTGLDFASGGVAGMLGGQRITSCVAADFGAVYRFGAAVVRARPVAMACTTACSTYCNTGDVMLVFAGNTTTNVTLLETVTMRPGSGLTDYRVGCDFIGRYVIVCRGGSGATRDDVVVDSIQAACTCM